ncbi:phosphonate C-P lyase system protein PhnH [Roseovarius sp. MBR-79]|jgi:phosphonate C-P lyase system protein PhnH
MKDAVYSIGPDPFETQALARAAISAMAHPGRVLRCGATCAGLLRAFVPAGTRLYLGEGSGAAGFTPPVGARLVQAPGEAVIAAAQAEAGAVLIAALSRGTLHHPEDGALLLLAVTGLSDEPDADAPAFWVGRGAAGGRTRRFSVAGFGNDFIAARAAVNAAYPMGVDILLVDQGSGTVSGLPRHSRLDSREV